MEVKLISTEIVKPSSPTPPNHQILTLSSLDQIFPPVSVPTLVVYTNSATVDMSHSDIIINMKTALAKTLAAFYPLAGRCIDENTVSCNDQGIPFRETHVDCCLTDVLDSPRKFDLFAEFVPPLDMPSFWKQPISDIAPLSFQVNVFQCGGMVIGCYSFHKLIDAASLSCFFNYWAAMASNRHDDLINPNFTSAVTAFPPLGVERLSLLKGGANKDDGGDWYKNLKPTTPVVGNNFIFSDVVIKKLKSKAISDAVPNPTSVEAVAGFVWQHMMIANKTNQFDPTMLCFAANIRSKTNPPLAKECMGNLVVDLVAFLEKYSDLPDQVKQIHGAILRACEKAKTLQSENGAEMLRAEKEADIQQSNGKEVKGTNRYTLTSWCKLGFNEVDFGFGRPSKVVPICVIHPFSRNFMFFTDYRDSDGNHGIEVWIFLGEEEIKVLESNRDFRAFAA